MHQVSDLIEGPSPMPASDWHRSRVNTSVGFELNELNEHPKIFFFLIKLLIAYSICCTTLCKHIYTFIVVLHVCGGLQDRVLLQVEQVSWRARR